MPLTREPAIPAKAVRIATRGSELALWQANAVLRQLQERSQQLDDELELELVVVTTQGDRDSQSSIAELGGKGVFVKEVQAAVLDGQADLAVHSAKDLPAQTPPGLRLAAVLERADPRDALVGCRLEDLPQQATVATGAPRRQALLKLNRPDLQLQELRGNIATRLQATATCDAVVVAAAALERLGTDCELPPQVDLLDPEVFVPQAGQGIIATECRTDDAAMLELLRAINHQPSWRCLQAERAFLTRLGGDCTLPAGAYAKFDPPNAPKSKPSKSGTGKASAPPATDQGTPDQGTIVGFLAGSPEILQVAGNLRDTPAEMGTALAELLLAEQAASPAK